MIRAAFGAEARSGSALAAAGLAIALGLASLSARVGNVDLAFRDGHAVFPPYDDVYHARRIAWSAAHLGRALEFDPERGAAGAWCPWPPLYDVAAGAALRPLSRAAATPLDDLATWIPPLAVSFAAGLLAFLLARRLSLAAAAAGAAVFAFSPSLFAASRLGCLDHHFLEPALALGILAATLRALSAGGRRRWGAGVLLAAALLLALFVQTALVFAAALSFGCLFAFGQAPARSAGALGFGLAAVVLTVWRLARPAGYPDSSWFLGWTHVAALAAAAVALAVSEALRRRAGRRGDFLALAAGAAVASGVPTALVGFLQGARFFGGDPWLASILEFQPLFWNPWSNPWVDAARLGAVPLLAVALAVLAWRSGVRPATAAVATFALAYAAASIGGARFLIPAAGPFAAAAALAVDLGLRRRGALGALGAATLALAPAAPLTILEIRRPPRTIPSHAEAPIRAAAALAAIPGPGRVLSSWSLGHLFHRWSGRPVLVDGFGSMPGRVFFENASAILLSTSEAEVARYCDETGARFVALENPLATLPAQAASLGIDPSRFLRPGATPDAPSAITRFMQSTFWWRAWADHGAALPRPEGRGAAFSRFRVVYADPSEDGAEPYRRAAIVVLERI